MASTSFCTSSTTVPSMDSNCVVCGWTFPHPWQLRNHMYLHSPPRHSCHTCPKQFADVVSLREHTRSHIHEKPFPCGLCGKKFSMKIFLKTHMREEHTSSPAASPRQ